MADELYDGIMPLVSAVLALPGYSQKSASQGYKLVREAKKELNIISKGHLQPIADNLSIWRYLYDKQQSSVAEDVSRLTVHNCADIYPMLSYEEMQALADDIKENGLIHEIVVQGNVVIDGRNRLEACKLAGVEPIFKTFDGDEDAIKSYILGANNSRRHLNTGQKAMAWVLLYPGKEKTGPKTGNNLYSENTNTDPSRDYKSKARFVQKWAPDQVPLVMSGAIFLSAAYETAKAAESDQLRADGGCVVEKSSERPKAKIGCAHRDKLDDMVKKRPDLAGKVRSGELSAASAIREMKTEAVVQRLGNIAAVQAKTLAGVYDVIVIDPPWPMQKIEPDERPNQTLFDYPTMTEEELNAFKLPMADDCHVWLWTTHKFLPMAWRLLEAWGLRYVCLFTWHKNGGFQPIGLPQYNCEFAIYARKGTPVFVDTKAFNVCFNAPRGAHSEKPEEFYDVVRRVTAGRRADIFNRRLIEGFDGWGNEA